MPMLKLCQVPTETGKQIWYLMQGTCCRDAEDKPVKGKPHAKVSVAAAVDESGNPIYVNLNGWRDRAADVLALRKRDSVLAIGPLKVGTYNDKLYYDLDAEFIVRSGVAGCADETTEPMPDASEELPELGGGDADLPF